MCAYSPRFKDIFNQAIDKQNAEQTFTKELTVNDIIRKVRERKERIEDIPYLTTRNYFIVEELNRLLNYIEKDGEYE